MSKAPTPVSSSSATGPTYRSVAPARRRVGARRSRPHGLRPADRRYDIIAPRGGDVRYRYRTPGPPRGTERTVLAAALALLVIQLGLRTWAAWSSWYFLDDLIFLRRYAEASSWDYLVEPYNGSIMPAAKGMYWVIRSIGPM